MDTAASQLLQSAAIKTLHAHHFSRSSYTATQVLADLLARYLLLLTRSAANHAHLAGRTALAPYDALAALDDVGSSIEELIDYAATDARELARYAHHSARRVEDLHELKGLLAVGLSQARDDAVLLDFMPYDSADDPDDDDDNDNDNDDDMMLVSSPPSSPLSPSRNPPRTVAWTPPSHIPAFLPPFPSIIDDPPEPDDILAAERMPPPPDPKPLVPVTQAITASASSDYFVQVPYSQSSLSSVPDWHLPTPPPPAVRPHPARKPPPTLQTLQTEPALFKAYHHILTHRAPNSPPPSTLSRHKVAMAFLSLSQNSPRWDAPDSLFSTVAPCSPRVASIGPSYPIALHDSTDKDFRFPHTIPRPVSTTERLTPLLGQPSNRIPELARHVLPPVVMNRITRLAHPPALYRGSKPLLYGRGIPAPWNSHTTPSTGEGSSNKDADNNANNTGGGGGNGGEPPAKPLIPDAQLLATWEFESKDYKNPLPVSSSSGSSSTILGRPFRSRVGSVTGAGLGAGVVGSSSSGNVTSAGRPKSGSLK